MKRGLLRAAGGAGLRYPIPVLAAGARLEAASRPSLAHAKTALFLPNAAGLRAFQGHAARAGLSEREARSMVATWWGAKATWRLS